MCEYTLKKLDHLMIANWVYFWPYPQGYKNLRENNRSNNTDYHFCIVLAIFWPSTKRAACKVITPPPPIAISHTHKDKKVATLKIVNTFQHQIRKNGSDAGIKMFGDITIAAGLWSWLLR